jgi:hypothetical protein
MKDIKKEEINSLLDQAYGSDDDEEIKALSMKVLGIDPDHPEGLLLLADMTEDAEQQVALLERALPRARRKFENSHGDAGDEFHDSDPWLLYMGVMQRLGFALFPDGDLERVLDIAEDLVKNDPEDRTLGKSLYYRCLLEMEKYGEILKKCLTDDNITPAMQHAKALSLFTLEGPTDDSYSALWDVFKVGPDIPFFLLGYWPEPDTEDEREEEDFNFSLLFEEAWSRNEETLNWLAKAAVLFGYFTNRLNERTLENMEILASTLELDDAFRDLSAKIEMEGSKDQYTGLYERDMEIIDILAGERFF